MQILSEFERRAWDARDSAEQQPPRRALLACADDIEADICGKVRHVAIVVVEDMGDGDRVHVYQAGDLSTLAVEGALGRAIRMERD